ncbi:GMP/IMP nucleotidase [Thiomicrospira pelophila]|uniref:GMP/IMP nucleotidase n=1 Tax=Thiomicrospira pelophila TaxID=934 RepID=UPI0004A6BE5A|nr:GMP/IMP nucleotidase [Thiomicrospira pelophila]
MSDLAWDEIDTVLLDMDGTLLDLHFDWSFWMDYLPEAYALHHNLGFDEAKKQVRTAIQEQTGTLNWYCLDYWSERFELSIADLKREIKHLIRAHPDVMTFLGQLRQLDKKVVMVTNAHRDSLALKLEMTQIAPYFDHLISAHDFGTPKEDIAIWNHIQSVSPYDPARTLLIDDNIHALQTAEQYGIAHLLAAVHVSPQMDRIDPQGFNYFEFFGEILPLRQGALHE